MKHVKIAVFILGGALVGAARAFPEYAHMLDMIGAALMALPARLDALLPAKAE